MKKLAALAIVIPALVSAAHSQSFTLIDTWATNANQSTGQLNTSMNLRIHNNGLVYVADHYNGRVQRYTKSGQLVDSFGSFGTGNGQFKNPTGLAFDSAGNVYVGDENNHRIQKFTANGTYLGQWGSFGSGQGQFNSVDAALWMTISKDDKLYVADPRNQRIQKFDLNGNYLSEFGTGGSGNGQFNFFGDLRTDSSGNVYVSDFYNNRIQKFDSNGNFISVFGSGVFNGPSGFVISPEGNFIVGDFFTGTLYSTTNTGSVLSSYGGSGSGLLGYPYGMDLDSDGRLFVCDLYPNDGNQIKVFQYGNPSNPGAVPEPSEWAAMGLLGTGLLGLVVRGRKKKLAH